MKRFLASGLILALGVSLTGCGESNAEIANLNGIQSLNSEFSSGKSSKLSMTDEQNMLYAQVSDRQLLDLTRLDACSDQDLEQIQLFLNNVDRQLCGDIYTERFYQNMPATDLMPDLNKRDESVISPYLTDYLLTFFEKTPYYWQRTKTTVRGIDPSSRNIIVDVTYSTIDFEKFVQPESTIVLGSPDYEKLLKNRYEKWLRILETKVNSPNDSSLVSMETSFRQYYGDPEQIIAAQSYGEPTDFIYITGNQRTTTGLLDNDAEQTGGSCICRYILSPNYSLGINLGYTCNHAYITDFKLDSDITEGMENFTAEGYATVADSVYALIYNYFTAIDEGNYMGLYKLTNNFGSVDKYYQDLFDSTYQKHAGYSVSLFDITGTHIKCGIAISTKERAKDSNMTFPIYTDRYYAELELVGDRLVVDQLVLLSRTLDGEPAISAEEADLSGFSAQITLGVDDKLAIEKLIGDFAELQLVGDTTSDSYSQVVDTSMSTSQETALKTQMTSITGQARKCIFLSHYMQGTSNYAAVKCKELYQDAANRIIEADAEYEFILKGNRWYIYNYNILSSVALDSTNLSTKGCLYLVEPGKTAVYNSQVRGTQTTDVESATDTMVVYEHDAYTPVLKTSVEDQGLTLYTGLDITATEYNELISIVGMEGTYEDCQAVLSGIETLETAEGFNGEYVSTSDAMTELLELMAVVKNKINNRYESDAAYTNTGAEDGARELYSSLMALQDTNLFDTDSSYEEQFNILLNDLTTLQLWLRSAGG